MKNKFKKSDANGNQLPEEIGKGLNKEHLQKVMKSRISETYIPIRMSWKEKNDFVNKCGKGNASNVARILFKMYVNGEIE